MAVVRIENGDSEAEKIGREFDKDTFNLSSYAKMMMTEAIEDANESVSVRKELLKDADGKEMVVQTEKE